MEVSQADNHVLSLVYWMLFTIIVGVCIKTAVAKNWYKNKSLTNLPGPKPWPIFGNALQLDSSSPHITLTDWSQKYGEVYKVHIFHKVIVVLSSDEARREALLKCGTDFAGRPLLYRTNYVFRGSDIGFRNYSKELKSIRNAVHSSLKQYGSGLLKIEEHSHEAIRDVLHMISTKNGKPFDLAGVMYEAMCIMTASTAFGEVYKHGDKTIQEIKSFDTLVTDGIGVASGTELDLFPWLRFFPNKTFALLKEGKELMDTFIDKRLKIMKISFNPDARKCIGDDLLYYQQQMQEKGESVTDDVVKLSLVDLIIGGAGSTANALTCALLILINQPMLQHKLQEEIDEVIGSDRLPLLEERHKLPLMEATVLEVLRYTSQIPLIPRMTITDTSVKEYFIPKDTEVWINSWAVHHNEHIWNKPFDFDPYRFLDENGEILPLGHSLRKNLLPFGTGRRTCVGEVAARYKIYLFLTSMLQKFTFYPEDISSIPDPDPRKYRFGLVLHPAAAFQVKAVPRSSMN